MILLLSFAAAASATEKQRMLARAWGTQCFCRPLLEDTKIMTFALVKAHFEHFRLVFKE